MANQGPKRGPFEKVWFVPRRGVLNNFPIYETPDDALYDGLNVLVRRGGVTNRPGYVNHNTTSLLNRVMGATVISAIAGGAFQVDTFQNDAFQTASGGSNILILAGTTRRIYVFYAGNWVDITNTLLTGNDVSPVRFTAIDISTVLNTIIVNGIDTPRVWDSSSATVSNVSGSPPIWSDVTTISDRIIGIIPPYTVRWGNALSITTWPALNFRDVADTTDRVVAIRNLGTLGGVLYKEKSIWSVISIGGTDAAFFRFELRGFYDGPASPAAVVDANGVQYYMTTTGRVGRYDGTQHDWVADGVWDIIKNDLDSSAMNRAFGVYNPAEDEVYFYYPRSGDVGEIKGGVVVQRPRPQDKIGTHIAFPIRLSRAISTAVDLRLESNAVLAFDSTGFKSNTMTGDTDIDTVFSGFWQHGLAVVPGQMPFRIEEIEVFARRALGSGTLTVKPVTSMILDVAGGTVGTGASVDLANSAPVRDLKGADARGRFLGLRHEFTTPITLYWQGSRLTANPLEGVQ